MVSRTGQLYYSKNILFSIGVEVVIGTPGRLLDFIEESVQKLNRITYIIWDEVDQCIKQIWFLSFYIYI